MRVIVEEAHQQKLKVAAHATTPEGIKNALMAGVDSIEHGQQANREDLEMMKAKGTFLVPTVGSSKPETHSQPEKCSGGRSSAPFSCVPD